MNQLELIFKYCEGGYLYSYESINTNRYLVDIKKIPEQDDQWHMFILDRHLEWKEIWKEPIDLQKMKEICQKILDNLPV